MASPQPGVWGIDLGQCGVKALRLEMIEDVLTATAFDYIEYPKILTQPDADPDQLTRDALVEFLARNSIRGDLVVISVPGQSGLARFVKLPPVEERKVADIVRFEAKQQIPFPLEEVVWDFQKLGSGEVTDGFAMGTEIGLFALKRDMVFRYLQHFKDVNVEVHVVQMAPLALCNFIAFDLIGKETHAKSADEDGEETPPPKKMDKKQCVVALDIGTDNSNLVITDGDRIIWQRPIPLGGNHFTRALTKDMKLTFAKAEHLKRNAAKSPELRKILASLKTVLNDFVGEVQRSLGYFTNTHRDAEVQYMIGLGNTFRLPGLQKFLQDKLGLEVRKFGKMARVEGEEVMSAPTFVENLATFAVAYGLALQGLQKTRLTTNLLPYDVKLERLVRSKKPWALTAAACLILAVAGLTFARSMEKAAITGKSVDDVVDAAKKIKLEKKDLEDRHAAEENKLKNIQSALKRLAAGVEERWNWQLLNMNLNMALPSPDGKKVPEQTRERFDAKKEYYNAAAKKAFADLEKKRFDPELGLLDPEKIRRTDIEIKKNLIQVNLEAIDARYFEDLTGYYQAIRPKLGVDLKAMRLSDDDILRAYYQASSGAGGKPPVTLSAFALTNDIPVRGWVVEVRGYTYHQQGWQFIKNTFLENLNPDYVLKGEVTKGTEKPKGAKEEKAAEQDEIEFMPNDPNESFMVDDVFDIYRPEKRLSRTEFLGTFKITEIGEKGKPIKGTVQRNSRKSEIKEKDVVAVSFVPENNPLLDKIYVPPLHLDDKNEMPAVMLKEIMYERVTKRISYMFIYKDETTSAADTKKGVFKLLNVTQFNLGLKEAGIPPKNLQHPGEPPPLGGAKKPAAPAGPPHEENKDRTAWKPLGSPALNKVNQKGELIGAKRFEFVMLFIWQEPYLGAVEPAVAPPAAPPPPPAAPKRAPPGNKPPPPKK